MADYEPLHDPKEFDFLAKDTLQRKNKEIADLKRLLNEQVKARRRLETTTFVCFGLFAASCVHYIASMLFR